MWSVIAGIIVSTIIGVGLNEAQYHMSRKATKAINSAAKKISQKIAEDNSLYERFLNASSEAKANMAAQIAQTMGYGARFEGLRSQIAKISDQQDKAAKQHAKTQAELTEQANRTEQLRMDTGSLSGANRSESLANEQGTNADNTKIGVGYDQNIIGGLQSGSTLNSKQGETNNVQK